MKFKYVIGTSKNPYWNLALEETLFEYVDKNISIIYLWQNEKTIVVGKNQNVDAECLAKAFSDSGGKIARRKSGGGAVYHDKGNLNFSIICPKEVKTAYSYQKLICRVMDELKVPTEYNGRNDILTNGKKFSGNAEYSDGRVVCQHGTILVSSDIEIMHQYLTPSVSKLQRNYVASVESWVINLSTISDITIEDIKNKWIEIVDAEQLENLPDSSKIENKMKFYSDLKWIYGGVQ